MQTRLGARRRKLSLSSVAARDAAEVRAIEAAQLALWIESWKPDVILHTTVITPSDEHSRKCHLWIQSQAKYMLQEISLSMLNKVGRFTAGTWVTMTAGIAIPGLALNVPNVLLYRVKINPVADLYIHQWRTGATIEENKELDDELWLTFPGNIFNKNFLLQQLKDIATELIVDVWRRRRRATAVLQADTELPDAILTNILTPYISYHRTKP